MPDFDVNTPHIARIYDYWLGGKDNFEADRKAAELALAATPTIVPGVRANRRFLGRAVRYMAAEHGIRQFLDIGTGIPASGNTHEVAQQVAPESRVVYVDSDPIVLAHARALLTSRPEGATGFLDADARDTGTILAQAAKLLDFRAPVAVMLVPELMVKLAAAKPPNRTPLALVKLVPVMVTLVPPAVVPVLVPRLVTVGAAADR